MPANPRHSTAAVDTPWDGTAQEAKLAMPVTKARGNGMYAWHDAGGADPDGDGYPDAKSDSKFPHHEVDAQGDPGAANLGGCRAVLQRVDQSDTPDADHADIRSHAQGHLDDAQSANAGDLGPDLQLVSPRSHEHVTKALYEHAWALQPQVLSMMSGILRMRSAGGTFSSEELAERLEAARAQNGSRAVDKPYDVVGAVAIIPMYGLISQRMGLFSSMSGGTSIDGLRMALRDALADPDVSSIVFDVDSPGGSVDAIPEFAAELRRVRSGRKPMTAQVNTLSASAAYWLAAQMNEIVCTPSGEVGSIGVYALHEDYSKADEMAGIKTTLISAGKYKTEGNEFEPLSDEARAAIQDQVDTFYGMFVGDVAKGRSVSPDVVAANYGMGRTLLASKALAAGMVDRIDTLQATVARLQPAGINRAAAAALLPHRGAQAPIQQAAAAAAVHRADPAWNATHLRRGSKRRS